MAPSIGQLLNLLLVKEGVMHDNDREKTVHRKLFRDSVLAPTWDLPKQVAEMWLFVISTLRAHLGCDPDVRCDSWKLYCFLSCRCHCCVFLLVEDLLPGFLNFLFCTWEVAAFFWLWSANLPQEHLGSWLSVGFPGPHLIYQGWPYNQHFKWASWYSHGIPLISNHP